MAISKNAPLNYPFFIIVPYSYYNSKFTQKYGTLRLLCL